MPGGIRTRRGAAPFHGALFILYYAILSAITPPVAVAAYAAASIAEDNPLHIAGMAVRLSLAAFIVPFAFVYGTELLLQGNPLHVVFSLASAGIGIVLLAVSMEGYWRAPLSWWSRLLFAAAALCFIVPGHFSALAGVGVAVIAFVLARRFGESRKGS